MKSFSNLYFINETAAAKLGVLNNGVEFSRHRPTKETQLDRLLSQCYPAIIL